MFKKLLGLLGFIACVGAYAGPIHIVAAENFYGKVAEQLGGPYVQVTSILQNPQQDPHLFSSSPETAKAIANAQFIVYNGLGYDSWINNLIAAANPKSKHIIVVGDLTGKAMGDNPHIWYDPKTMFTYAIYLAAQLSQIDPSHQEYYQRQLEAFKVEYQTLLQKIQQLHDQYHGAAVIATEPVFNYMSDALGLSMNGQGFQTSIMNDTEPSVSDIKNFEDKLKNRQVVVLIYNNQVTNPATDRMKNIAEKSHIPIVGVSETEPLDQDYVTWMLNQLNDLDHALSKNQKK